MPVFSDLETRVTQPPFDQAAFDAQLPACQTVAQQMPLVHVTGERRPFEQTMAKEPWLVPTSADTDYYTEDTRRAEGLLGLPRSAYFYAGRACQRFGNLALAFSPQCDAQHAGSATPLDSGGLMHPSRHIKLRLAPTDGDAQRAAYGQQSLTAFTARLPGGMFSPRSWPPISSRRSITGRAGQNRGILKACTSLTTIGGRGRSRSAFTSRRP